MTTPLSALHNFYSLALPFSSIMGVLQPGLQFGSCRQHEVLFIMGWFYYFFLLFQ